MLHFTVQGRDNSMPSERASRERQSEVAGEISAKGVVDFVEFVEPGLCSPGLCSSDRLHFWLKAGKIQLMRCTSSGGNNQK